MEESRIRRQSILCQRVSRRNEGIQEKTGKPFEVSARKEITGNNSTSTTVQKAKKCLSVLLLRYFEE